MAKLLDSPSVRVEFLKDSEKEAEPED
jgi:hypothetical protein